MLQLYIQRERRVYAHQNVEEAAETISRAAVSNSILTSASNMCKSIHSLVFVIIYVSHSSKFIKQN